MATSTAYKREGPFTHRSWKDGFFGMVSNLSAMGTKLSLVNGESPPASDDHAAPAPKRRRITEDLTDSTNDSFLDRLAVDPPGDFEKTMRIEVLKIANVDGSELRLNEIPNGFGSPPKRDTTECRARCKITVCNWNPPREYRILYCDNQVCDIKMVHDADGVCRMARVYLPRPFDIPVEKIYVERDDNQGFGLAEKYVVHAELESAGDPSWPPRSMLSSSDMRSDSPSPPRRWVLFSHFKYSYDERSRMTSSVHLRKQVGHESKTDLVMDMDLRWSTFGSMSRGPRMSNDTMSSDAKSAHLNGALEPLTNGHLNGRSENLANGHGKDDMDIIMDDDVMVDGEVTPSRALRARGQQNYNLKLLSDKARGKERKERKQRKLAEGGLEDGEVAWLLPNSGRIVMQKYTCITCFATHSSMHQLEHHIPVHHECKFSIQPLPKGGYCIAVSRHGQETPRAPRTALVEPPTPIEDESDSGLETSPRPRHRQRSPKRSETLYQPAQPPKPRDTKQTVPKIEQTIFDRLSKVVLEPGARVDEPQIDDTWLLQKHRDIIRDYSDMDQDEKDYVTTWDAWMAKERVTSELQLQEVYLKFVQTKASWLAGSQNRVTEFAKHMNYLKARGAITEATIIKALDITRNARYERSIGREQPEPVVESSPKAEARRSESGCADCGQPVLGPSSLICSNLDCDKPLYHVGCARENAKMPVDSRNWQCDHCHKEGATA